MILSVLLCVHLNVVTRRSLWSALDLQRICGQKETKSPVLDSVLGLKCSRPEDLPQLSMGSQSTPRSGWESLVCVWWQHVSGCKDAHLWSCLQQTGSPEGTGPAAWSQVTGGCFPLWASVFVNERPGLGHDGEALQSQPATLAFPWAPCTRQAPSAETPFFSLSWKREDSMTGLAPWPSVHRVAGQLLPAVPGTGVLPEQVPS